MVQGESTYAACKPVFDQLWHLNRSQIFGATDVFCTDRVLFNTKYVFFYLHFLENKYVFCNQSMNNETFSWMADFRKFRISTLVNKYIFVCLSRLMCTYAAFHKPSHKKVSEALSWLPLPTFHEGMWVWKGATLHRRILVKCFCLETNHRLL